MWLWLSMVAWAVPGDLDDDGIPDAEEDLWPDVDGDGTPNRLDTDSDGDGHPDSVEYLTGGSTHDSDGDGTPDYVDTDSDDDGLPDVQELATDTDGDGLVNRVDPDDDGDNVPTIDEDWDGNGDPRDNDSDGDGVPDFLDQDDDDDSVLTILEDWQSPGDPLNTNTDRPTPTDPLDVFQNGDMLPDYRDVDDDADGRPTIEEDFDGIPGPMSDNYDALVLQLPACLPGQRIRCSDERPDFQDWDDEGDGVPTFAEEMWLVDPYNLDHDGDGFLDGEEWINFIDIRRVPLAEWMSQFQCGELAQLTDADGDVVLNIDGVYVSGYYDQDVDQDGIPDTVDGRSWSQPWDRDCDYDPNVNDIDDDGDGLNSGVFLSGGWESGADQDCRPGTGIPEGDGIPNYLDIDSDGHTQTVAAGTHPNCPEDPLTPFCMLTTDGAENLADSDDDFVPDAFDCDESGADGDSDADGLSNAAEAELCPIDFVQSPICPPGHPFYQLLCSQNPDSDCDGVLDCEEAGVPCPTSSDYVPVTSLASVPDTDGDLLVDMYDPDDDGDGIDTVEELDFVCPPGQYAGPATLEIIDTNGDGVVDEWQFFCVDDANQRFGRKFPSSRNTDATGSFAPPFPLLPDAAPDYLDDDDDGDGRPTADEGREDADADGTPNYLDPHDFDGPEVDADADGFSNGLESSLGTDPYRYDSDQDGLADPHEVGDPNSPIDTDGDGLIDALDPDDDDDGIPSAVEGSWDLDEDGVPNHQDLDSDSDGTPDADEPGDANGDGIADALDPRDTRPVDPIVEPPPEEPKGCASAGAGDGRARWWFMSLGFAPRTR